jgi:DNA polymerase III alpha subunit
VGLGRVEGLGPANVEAILIARRRGPFVGLSDCLGRTGLGRNEARSLVLCGAFDWTVRTRPTLMMELNLFYALGSWRHSPDVMLLPTGPTIPNVPGDYSPRQKYLQERHILGLSVGEHILAFYRGLSRGVGILPACGVGVSPENRGQAPFSQRQPGFAKLRPGKQRENGASPHFSPPLDADSRDLPRCVGRTIRIAGMLEAYRATPTQKGETMLFLTLDDEYGVFEVTLFPPQARALGTDLSRYGPYIVTGKVEKQYGVVSVTADRVELVSCEESADTP